jgi:hypothetical protein
MLIVGTALSPYSKTKKILLKSRSINTSHFAISYI